MGKGVESDCVTWKNGSSLAFLITTIVAISGESMAKQREAMDNNINRYYEAPDSELLEIRYEANIMSEPAPGTNEGVEIEP